MNQKKKTGWKRYAVIVMAFVLVLGSIVSIGNLSLSAKAAVGKTIRSLKVIQAEKNVMKKTIEMKIGASKKLAVKAKTVLSKKNVTFHSSNEKVVTVNKNGKLTAKKSGSARITVTVHKKGFKTKKTWVKISVTNSVDESSETDQSPEPPTNSSDVSDNTSDSAPLPTENQGTDVPDTNIIGDAIETPKPDVTDVIDTSVTPDSSEPNSGNNTGNILVAYFSWSGTSERIARNIIDQTGADSFRIERETPYSDDYNTVAYGEAKEEADNNARPPIKNPLDSIAAYDKIVLCYPIWWHTAPMTVGTFLESYDMTGKIIYPISQSASMSTSQYEESVAFIKACAKDAIVDDGLFTKDNDSIQNYIENTVLGS